MKYIIQCKENGDLIEEVETLREAKEILNKYEEDDKKDGIYEEDFYEIAQLNKETQEKEIVY